jgi:hypothetical protein
MTILCPHCHLPIAEPPALPYVLNQLFNFILTHPGCSTRQVEIGLYGRPKPGNCVVSSNLANLVRRLEGTDFRLIRAGHTRRRSYTITIISRAKPIGATAPTDTLSRIESHADGTDQHNRRIP